DQQQLCVHDASATRCNHETEVSRGSPQGSIPGMPITATQNAFGTTLTRESKRRKYIHENQTFIFHKLPGCRRVDCFAFIWQTGEEIRRHVAVQGDKSSSAHHASDAQRSP